MLVLINQSTNRTIFPIVYIIPNWIYYPQLDILSPLGNIRSPIGDDYQIGDWGYLKLGKCARKNSKTSNRIKNTKLLILHPQSGIKYTIRDIFCQLSIKRIILFLIVIYCNNKPKQYQIAQKFIKQIMMHMFMTLNS